MSVPLISVIIPTKNRAPLLKEAIESVLAVGNAHADRFRLEIFVIDDGSTDDTAEVVRAYPVEFLHTHSAHGASAGRNAGMAAARGDYIAFLDDDDIWLPNNVAAQLTLLEAHPEFGAVIGQSQLTNPDLTPFGAPVPTRPARSGWLFEYLLSVFPQIATWLVRAEVAHDVGQFDLTLLGDQDWDWILRLAKRAQIGMVEETVMLFRQRNNGDLALMRRRQPYLIRVFRKNTQDLPLWRRIRLERIVFKHRGGMAANYYLAAQLHSKAGDRKQARRSLTYAFTASPLHTLRLLLARHGQWA